SIMKTKLSCLLVIGLLSAGNSLCAEPKEQPLTNADVIKMLENKIPDGVILSKIEAGQARFDTSTDAIIILSRKGASESVLSAVPKEKPAPSEATANTDPQDPATTKPAEASAPPVATGSGEKHSALSYGTATGLVKKGVTTQQELLEMFGGPNVMTTDKE